MICFYPVYSILKGQLENTPNIVRNVTMSW